MKKMPSEKTMEKFVIKVMDIIEGKEKAKLSNKDIEMARIYVDFLCDMKNETGLKVKAWSSYTGNLLYPQNWKLAEMYLLKSLEEYQNPYAANALGYIYYYGRVNDGVAEYDKALQFFTLASMANIIEARYKLTDFMVSGKGFPMQMPNYAYNILVDMYKNELLPKFREGNFSCEFADVAIRLGNLFMDTAEEDAEDAMNAYMYYLISKYALDLRMKSFEQYGDKSILAKLLPKIEKAKNLYRNNFRATKKELGKDINLIIRFVEQAKPIVTVKENKKGEYSLKLMSFEFETFAAKELIVLPESDYCSLIGKIKLSSVKAMDIGSSVGDCFTVDYAYIKNDSLRLCTMEETKEGKACKRILLSIALDDIGSIKAE